MRQPIWRPQRRHESVPTLPNPVKSSHRSCVGVPSPSLPLRTSAPTHHRKPPLSRHIPANAQQRPNVLRRNSIRLLDFAVSRCGAKGFASTGPILAAETSLTCKNKRVTARQVGGWGPPSIFSGGGRVCWRRHVQQTLTYSKHRQQTRCAATGFGICRLAVMHCVATGFESPRPCHRQLLHRRGAVDHGEVVVDTVTALLVAAPVQQPIR